MRDDRHILVEPPHAIAAEQSVLGCLLIDNRVYDRLYDLIGEHDFYLAHHRQIWREAVRLIEANKPADVITLAPRLRDIPQTDRVLTELVGTAPSALNARHYAELVRGKSILRALLSASSDISAAALEHGADPHTVAERAEAQILAVLDHDAPTQARDPVSLKDAAFEAVDWLEEGKESGIKTGYTNFDAMFPSGGGLQPEQLVVIAGRPAMGKSSLAWCIAEHAAADGHPVAYFTLETSRRELAVRSIRWHESLMEGGRQDAVRYLSELPIMIDDSPAITLSHLRIRLRRIRRNRGLKLAVVDYLQLMTHRAQDRLQEVSAISRGLKAIAKEFQIPVIAVCQINRAVEGRVDRRPIMSDLRESGQLEQDADVIAMLYRDEVYNEGSHLKGYGELLVRKMRDGPIGSVLLRWQGERTRFTDHTGPWPVPAVTAGDSSKVKAFRPKGDAA